MKFIFDIALKISDEFYLSLISLEKFINQIWPVAKKGLDKTSQYKNEILFYRQKKSFD